MFWSVHGFNGILIILDDFSFSIDPTSKDVYGDIVLVSHAHGDHIAGLRCGKYKLASHHTFKLYEAYSNRSVGRSHHAFMNGQRFSLFGVDLEVYDAGHILGSLQFRFEKFSSSIVYTGDLNLVDTLITRAGEIVECDELIIDATYGNPRIIFPDRWSVYEDLSGFVDSCVKVGKPPVFKAYTVGKAQEIIALINGFLGMEVLVDSRIARVNEVYRFAGVDLNYISLASDDGKDAFKSMSLPLVTSNHDVFRVASSMGMVKALATGWSILYSFPNYDAHFPLSSHADFNQLVSYIERAKPSRVYPVGHYARDLSTWLRKNMSLYSIPLDDLA